MSGEPTAAPGGRLRWTIGTVAAVAVAVVGAGTWVAVDILGSPGCVDTARPKSYRVAEPKHMRPIAVSPSGEYAVGTHTEHTDRFVLWQDGELSTIKAPAKGAEDVRPADVNDSGVVVGSFDDADSATARPWRYESGEFTVLSGPDGSKLGTVNAVNADGTMAGQVTAADSRTENHAATWAPGDTEATVLKYETDSEDEFAVYFNEATDISADGVAVGRIGDEVWVWQPDGRGRRLTEHTETARAPTIAGDWAVANNRKWNLAEDRRHPRPDNERALFNAIDSCGRMYGVDRDANGDAIVQDRKQRELPKIGEPVAEDYPDDPDEPLGEVTAVSDTGAVLVGESNGRGAIWTYE